MNVQQALVVEQINYIRSKLGNSLICSLFDAYLREIESILQSEELDDSFDNLLECISEIHELKIHEWGSDNIMNYIEWEEVDFLLCVVKQFIENNRGIDYDSNSLFTWSL